MHSFRKEILKKVILTKPYIFYFGIVFIIYFVFNFYVNQLYVTGWDIFSTYRVSFFVPFVFFLIFIPILVALNVNLVIHKFGELKSLDKRGNVVGGVGFLGMVGGLIGGACPGCFAGLFPAIVGIFGISATLVNLPFYGLEIQVLSSVFLLISIYYLTKPVKCEIDLGK